MWMGKHLQVDIHHHFVVVLIWLLVDVLSAPGGSLPARCERIHPGVLNFPFVYVVSPISLIQRYFLTVIKIVRTRGLDPTVRAGTGC